MDDNTRWLRNNILLKAKYCIKADGKKEERNKLIRNVRRQQQRAWQSPGNFFSLLCELIATVRTEGEGSWYKLPGPGGPTRGPWAPGYIFIFLFSIIQCLS
jgi:hypothetical protein